MKISVDYKQTENDTLSVGSANYIGDFAVRISFTDGTEKLVDFKPFLMKAIHPSIKKYLDESQFLKYEIVDGNLNWNDYDMIFPIWDLYQGKI